jgi:hypothetical protein
MRLIPQGESPMAAQLAWRGRYREGRRLGPAQGSGWQSAGSHSAVESGDNPVQRADGKIAQQTLKAVDWAAFGREFAGARNKQMDLQEPVVQQPC